MLFRAVTELLLLDNFYLSWSLLSHLGHGPAAPFSLCAVTNHEGHALDKSLTHADALTE